MDETFIDFIQTRGDRACVAACSAIVRKETREVLRDPIYLGLAIAVPVVVMTLLALGFVLDVKNLPVAFYDEDRSPLSREYIVLVHELRVLPARDDGRQRQRARPPARGRGGARGRRHSRRISRDD